MRNAVDPGRETWDCLVLTGDCLQWLQHFASSSVHLTITDPPYESLERHRAKGTTTRLKESNASSNPWFECFPNLGYYELFTRLHIAHAANTHCYVFCDSETEHVILSGRNPYDRKLDEELLEWAQTNGPTPPKGLWTAWPPPAWVKVRQACAAPDGDLLEEDALRIGMGYHWRRTKEQILFLEKGKRKLKHLSWPDVLLGPKAERKDFPTAKPVAVLTRLIMNSSEESEVILDPFAGSGKVAHEALSRGRRCILIEKNPTDWLRETLEPWRNTTQWRTW